MTLLKIPEENIADFIESYKYSLSFNDIGSLDYVCSEVCHRTLLKMFIVRNIYIQETGKNNHLGYEGVDINAWIREDVRREYIRRKARV